MAWTERYVRDDASGSGDGTADTSGSAWTLAQAISSASNGHRINIRVGTYTQGANIDFSKTQTAWRGFNTTPGDCDTDPTLTRPTIAMGSYRFIWRGTQSRFENLIFTSSNTETGTFITASEVNFMAWRRCRFVCTAANSNGSAFITLGNQNFSFKECEFVATTSATKCVAMPSNSADFSHCYFEGGARGLSLDSNFTMVISNCYFTGQTVAGVYTATNGVTPVIRNCTFRSITGDGYLNDGSNWPTHFEDCVFANIGGYAIRSNYSTYTFCWNLLRNSFYSVTSGKYYGITDALEIGTIDEASDPFPDAGTGDITLASGSSSRGAQLRFPGLASSISYRDRGAVQHQDAGGGGGVYGARIFTGF